MEDEEDWFGGGLSEDFISRIKRRAPTAIPKSDGPERYLHWINQKVNNIKIYDQSGNFNLGYVVYGPEKVGLNKSKTLEERTERANGYSGKHVFLEGEFVGVLRYKIDDFNIVFYLKKSKLSKKKKAHSAKA
ncbi:hypothetical protein HZC32_02200 [Candidatus Woesearchaeota archaeon]|nr:hypothetical protein [Candidatus Woesearchaeota archaeon]